MNVIYHLIQAEGIVMCLWCRWKDLDDDSNSIEFMLWDLDWGSEKYEILNDVDKLSSCYFVIGSPTSQIQVEGIVMCCWCCWKDLDDSDLIKFMLWDLNLGCGRYGIEYMLFDNGFTLASLTFNSSKYFLFIFHP